MTKESKNDAETPPGPSRQKKRKSSSARDDASDDSGREVTALLDKVEEQDGDGSDKLLQEIEEEYNNEDKTGPDVNVHLANLVNRRFAGKLKKAKLNFSFNARIFHSMKNASCISDLEIVINSKFLS